MKNLINENFLIILAAIGLIFLVTVYFVGLGNEGGIFTSLGSGVESTTQESYITDIAPELEGAVTTEIPTIHYSGGARTVGDVIELKNLFDVEYEDGTTVKLSEATNLKVVLKDVRDKEDNLVVTKLSTEDIEALEEIPTAFIFDKEQNLLYFHKSGIFTVYIKIYSGTGNGILYQFSIPVEVR